MAKAKKPTVRKGAGSEKSAGKSAPAGVPLIDTNFAAQTAARMLAARAKLKDAAAAPQAGKTESAGFKEMKEHLRRPAAHAASTALGTAYGPQKTNLPAMGREQVVHNQIQGSNRVSVPRRTAG